MNPINAKLISKNNPNVDQDRITYTILQEDHGNGFGDLLHEFFDPFVGQSNDCGCPGYQDVLNVWTPEHIEQNLDTIAKWLCEEASKRRIPHSRLATKLLLKALLIYHRSILIREQDGSD